MSEPLKLLFDSNIWLDLYFPDRPGHVSANKLIDEAFSVDADIYYAANTITDVFFLVKATQKRALRQDGVDLTEGLSSAANEVAWGCIRNIYDIASPIPTSLPVLFLATKMKDVHADFEDDVILASAQTADVDFLVTNDRGLLTKAIVPALSSSDMLAYLKNLSFA